MCEFTDEYVCQDCMVILEMNLYRIKINKDSVYLRVINDTK